MNFNLRFVWLCWLLLSFLLGCTSAPDGYVTVSEKHPVHSLMNLWEAGCLEVEEPGFSAFLKVTGQPELTLDGVWSQNFEEFRAQIVSPLGATLLEFELSSKGFVRKLSGHDVSRPVAGFESFETLLQELGPKELRRVVCGTFVAHSNNTSIFAKKGTAIPPEARIEKRPDNFFILTSTKFTSGSVNWRTEMIAEDVDKEKKVTLNSLGNLPYGRGSIARLKWVGTISRPSHAPHPEQLVITSEEGTYEATFTEFD